MKLSYAFLATAADHTADGRLWIAGADFDAFRANLLPVTGQFVIIAKVVFEDSEAGQHDISLGITAPNGERKTLADVRQSLNVVAEPPKTAVAKILLHVAMTFEAFGKNVLHLNIDGTELAAVPLEIQQLDLEPSNAGTTS